MSQSAKLVYLSVMDWQQAIERMTLMLSVLWGIVKGVAEVANKFLIVEGQNAIQITAGK